VTYSIIGRDDESGALGIAVQSRWFHAGEDLAWIEPGVGAVCTQAFLEPSYGPLSLALLRHGRSPESALAELTASDEGRDLRQVAVMSAGGAVAQHTGARCVRAAGDAVGRSCCAQGNMLANESCWPAMVEAFDAGEGDLVDRLLGALDAAEVEGGDARGRQAAAVLVRPAAATGVPWRDRVLDLRVVDHPRPVSELRRLVTVHRAYGMLASAFDLAERDDLDGAVAAAESAQVLVPGEDQIAFWRATLLARAGRLTDARAALDLAASVHPAWVDFVGRCIEAGLLPSDAEELVARST
jgi:uncharacterized Ntn-hydrolase superfamily protein